MNPKTSPQGVDHGSDPRFVAYYALQSSTDETDTRFRTVRDKLLGLWAEASGRAPGRLCVADIGCGAGASSRVWTELGHRVLGLDVNAELIRLARERAAAAGLDAEFEVGTATALPWASSTVDICMLPELLEHVADWQSVLDEATRVLRPGGALYLSTTNVMCPIQQEFTLPGYSWYPAALKRYCVHVALTTHPRIANFATYPAVNWFTYGQVAAFLEARGMTCRDRLAMIDLAALPGWKQALVRGARALAPARWAAHVVTPSLAVFAYKAADGRGG